MDLKPFSSLFFWCYVTGMSGASCGKKRETDARSELREFEFMQLPMIEEQQRAKAWNSFCLKSIIFLMSFIETVFKPFLGTFLLVPFVANAETFNRQKHYTVLAAFEPAFWA